MSDAGLHLTGRHVAKPPFAEHEFDNHFTYKPNSKSRPANGDIKEQRRQLKVWSPKVRSGWQKEAVDSNYGKSRGCTTTADFQSVDPPERRVPRGTAGCDGRFGEIRHKQTSTQVDKLLQNSGDASTDPQPAPKCPTADSMMYYRRNQRGTISDQPIDQQLRIRCTNSAARENLEKGKGQAGHVIYAQDGRMSPQPQLRLGLNSRQNYEQARGSCMSAVFNQKENLREGFRDPAPCGRVVKGDAAAQNAARNRGQAIDIVGSESGTQPNARVRPEAKGNAEREGAGVRDAFFGSGQPDPPPNPRVRLGGADVANKLASGSLTQQQYNCSHLQPDPQPNPKVRPEAQENYRREQAVVTKNLLQKYGNLPAESQPKPHVPPQAWNAAFRARGGAMRDCINPAASSNSRRRRRRRRPATAF